MRKHACTHCGSDAPFSAASTTMNAPLRVPRARRKVRGRVFSRRARRLMRWRPGETRRIKRRYTKRWRKIARIVVNRDANSIIPE
ncbi:hypothetical protein V5F31_21255 [Xanthobacter sp. V7C-4]|uniref:hypothetical protein n=1 Tax=Xanthobacter autotrophicus (strain ATCC BAA-1158 / Py2) TaxID=78245 RepID=UPI003729DC1C